MLILEDFIERCNQGKCLRHTFISKNCKRSYKQNICYKKYLKHSEKINEKFCEDLKWKEVCEEVDKRDGEGCKIWDILSAQQRQFILEVYPYQFRQFFKIIDKAHIIPRSQSKELYYEHSNILNVSRYFHTLLDNLSHPVTQQPITKKERLRWMLHARQKVKDKIQADKNKPYGINPKAI